MTADDELVVVPEVCTTCQRPMLLVQRQTFDAEAAQRFCDQQREAARRTLAEGGLDDVHRQMLEAIERDGIEIDGTWLGWACPPCDVYVWRRHE